jgi:tetratricopeptide (TPR) repeat protein
MQEVFEQAKKSYISATALRRKADIYMAVGLHSRAFETYQECFQQVQHTVGLPRYADKPWVPWENLARAEVGMGDACRALHRDNEAETYYVSAHQRRQKWLELGQDQQEAEQAVATSLGKLGMLYQTQHMPTKALPLFEQSFQLRQKYLQSHPDDLSAQREWGGAMRAVGLAKRDLGQYDEASENLRRALACWTRVLNAWDEEKGYQGEYQLRVNVAMCSADLGKCCLLDNKTEEAAVAFEGAVKRLHPLHEGDPDNEAINRSLRESLYGLATCRLASDPKTAGQLFAEVLTLNPGDGMRMLALARLHRTDEAAQLAAQFYKDSQQNQSRLYRAACGYALCVWSVGAAAGQELTPELTRRREEYAQKCVAALREAIKQGFDSPSELQNNPELDAVRDRPDFQQLVTGLQQANPPDAAATAPENP